MDQRAGKSPAFPHPPPRRLRRVRVGRVRVAADLRRRGRGRALLRAAGLSRAPARARPTSTTEPDRGGRHPVLIDLGPLFHRSPFDRRLAGSGPRRDRMVRRAGRAPPLPLLVRRLGDSGVEISGLGGSGSQLTPLPVGAWEESGTDAMRFVRRRLAMPARPNRPTLRGGEVLASDFAGEIEGGFRRMYRLLVDRRRELLAEAGPIERFSADPVRRILRPTQVQGLLAEAFHPQLREALSRERLFDALWVGSDESRSAPAHPARAGGPPPRRRTLFTARPGRAISGPPRAPCSRTSSTERPRCRATPTARGRGGPRAAGLVRPVVDAHWTRVRSDRCRAPA